MLREKELIPVFNSDRMEDSEATSIEAFKNTVAEISDKYGASVEFFDDEVTHGNFFCTDASPCLIMYHKEHRNDYYNYCVIRKIQGSTCVYHVYICGNSKQMKKEQFQQNTKVFDGSGSRGTAVGALRGGSVGAGFAVGSAAIGITKGGIKMIAKGINALTMDKAALAEEKEWYELMGEILSTALS